MEKIFAGLYLHIPFCKSKCPYCDFVSGIKPDDFAIQKYIRSLCNEIRLYAESHPDNREIRTIYIGGGTPSLLSPQHLNRLFDTIKLYFNGDITEITLEANPDDVTLELAKAWKSLGINRVSLGMQAMKHSTLIFLGRRNSVQQNEKAFGYLRQAGIQNISADIILTTDKYELDYTVDKIAEMGPEHISAYVLTLEQGTELYRRVEIGEYTPPSDEAMLENYWKTNERLIAAGYIYYEISNYAKSGYKSMHNLNYWNYGEYIGLGLGASGFLFCDEADVLGYRWRNNTAIEQYYICLEKNKLPIETNEPIERGTAIREYIMLGLRKIEGFGLSDFAKLFGTEFFSVADKRLFDKIRDYVVVEDGMMKLTERGIDVMNSVIVDIWDMME